MNDYLNDAILFLARVPKNISESMNKDEVLDGTLFWALGTERLLKGILYDLNPSFIFPDNRFNNLVPILYKDKLVRSEQHKSTLVKNPSGDVITFRQSLSFVVEISSTTQEYEGRLYTLNNNRNILAHCSLRELSLDKAKLSLQRDFFPMITSFCNELHIDSANIFQKYDEDLNLLSIRLQENQEQRIARLIEFHLNKWNQNLEKVKTLENISIVMTDFKRKNPSYVSIDCPACGNEAILNIEPDVDVEGFECIYYGLSIGLECKYCGLTIDDPEDLDYLDINEGTIFS